MLRRVRVRGRGRVLVSAYGIADAEHLVEKELARLCPEAAVRIEEISRAGPHRIVEEFDVTYIIDSVVEVTANSEKEAVAAAFRQARHRLEGSRYAGTRWNRE